MTDFHPELLTAARHLVQWGRTRQTAWHDPSSELLAALGNRYASFDDLHAGPAPPPVVPLPTPQPVQPVPVDVAPLVLPVPVVTPRVSVMPAATQVGSAPRRQVSAPFVPPRRLSLGRVAAIALVVLAAAAFPSLRRAYESKAVVAPQTNTLTIESTPAGSTVLIDGVESGRTPLTTTVVLGRHAVELRHRKTVRRLDVDVTAGTPVVARVDWNKRETPKKRASKDTLAGRADVPAARKPATGSPAQRTSPASAPGPVTRSQEEARDTAPSEAPVTTAADQSPAPPAAAGPQP